MLTLTKPITYQEFKEIEFEEWELKEFFFELIDGEIMRQNYPSFKHQFVSSNLLTYFHNFIKSKNLGIVLHAPFGVILDDINVLQPDIMFVSNVQKHMITQEGIMGAPALIVEIISPSSIKTDRFIKYQIYESKGVLEYWIIDLKNESIEVFENTERGFKPFSFANLEGKIFSKVLEGLAITVAEIFAS